MASYIGYTRGTAAPATTGPSTRVCPDCGGLECLCRPRFFAGQLLTADDRVNSPAALTGWSRLLDDAAAPANARRNALRMCAARAA